MQKNMHFRGSEEPALFKDPNESQVAITPHYSAVHVLFALISCQRALVHPIHQENVLFSYICSLPAIGGDISKFWFLLQPAVTQIVKSIISHPYLHTLHTTTVRSTSLVLQHHETNYTQCHRMKNQEKPRKDSLLLKTLHITQLQLS